MKNFLTSLLLMIPILGMSQPASWFKIEAQFDFYGPTESLLVLTQDGDTLLNHQPTTNFEYFETIVFTNAGEITVSLIDNFGDGWEDYTTDANLTILNDCQGIILNLDANFPFSQYDEVINLLPCPPPTIGCIDPEAVNFDPGATLPNNSCIYNVEFTLNMNSYPDEFGIPYVAGPFNGWTDTNPMSDEDGDNVWNVTIPIQNGNYVWKFMLDNWTDQELPPNVTNNPYASCFTLDQFGFTNRTLLVNGQNIVLDEYCWESCYNCGDVLGCTNPSSSGFNPWATIDDGSCLSGPSTCLENETFIEIVFTPDNYPSESGYKLFSDDGLILEYLPGSFNGVTPGLPISEFVCVDSNVLLDIVFEDTYGDGLCGTCFGGTVDGNLQVFDCEGNELFNLLDDIDDGNFGYLYTTPQFNTGDICDGVGGGEILGCTNPFSLTYDLTATTDDGSCGPLRILGCTDETAFNFDSLANTSEIMSGDYTLEIFDGASNGWGGTWLGIKQGDWLSPQYKMGPQDGYSLTFDVNLNIYEPIQVYLFTTPQSATSIAQIGYELSGPLGDVILEVPFWGAQSLQFPVVQTTTSQPDFGTVCVESILGCTEPNSLNFDSLANTDDGSCIPIVLGCTNPLAFNFNELANVDDESCIAAIVGCLDPTMFNFNPEANTEGTCIPFINGCTDETAFNYDSNANTDDGTCVPVVLGCTDATAFNYNENSNTDDGSCIETIFGCTDTSALNYNPLANTDNGTCEEIVLGCMTPTSINYNPLANVNDGSCIPFIYGCTDNTAFNFNPLANTDDESCVPIIFGCTNATSINFNIEANTDDGSCIPFIYGCTDNTAFNFNPLANTDNGTCEEIVLGCTVTESVNFNINANTDDGSCIPFIYGCTDNTAFNYNELANVDNGTCEEVIEGCMDPLALNFDPLANVNNFDCIEAIYGCTDPLSFNYNELANVDNGTCEEIVLGCTITESINFNVSANTDDGSCIPFIYGCTDNTAFNFNPLANTDNGTCQEVVLGCTTPTSINFDVSANTDDGSCIPFIYGCTDSNSFNFNPLANTDNGTCEEIVLGCTTPTSINFDPSANTDDGTCIPFIYGCTDPVMFNFNDLANTDDGSCIPVQMGCTNPIAINYDIEANTDDNSCILPIYGCTDSTMWNFNPLANTDNGTCEPFIYGCTDPESFNYNSEANTNQVSETDLSNPCIPIVYGCTDSTAINFNPDANIENGSCIETIVGCTDVSAWNFDPTANVSDLETCLYDAGCIGGPGEPYWLNDPCFAWVIDVDNYCCDNEWDNECQTIYQYCVEGSTTNIEEILFNNITIFPNPTKDILNVKTNLNISYDVYDFMGKKIIENSNESLIDLTTQPSGMYLIEINYKNNSYRKKIIKEN